ncbi:DUF2384 domain-containing protein [Pseudomonas sp. C1C7]|uniref:antitoxin Xre/MbcA/ParS toxin-binding domain-containing protein n=1 Tax=Pseudomonas sp. C1C7 TaxID=2735272 RepID=UPI001586F442|nr:antitoxin Xre/MbcA/ParS toxin-binding domain-containing protein [Pseudomonas sp. C1C7]NUT74144.1 DUF2384 domain-containing protein [Pseudomonas sp. C1C7]
MIAECLPKPGYVDYRTHLQLLLNIPLSASNFEIHNLIYNGFPAASLLSLVGEGVITPSERSRIISSRALHIRVQHGGLLTGAESDRLFRCAHILSMAMAVFGSSDKARRWLDKPKTRFAGHTPTEMSTTLCGMNQVEEMLLQITNSYAL